MITRKKEKYFILAVLIFVMAAGMLGFMKVEQYLNAKVINIATGTVTPVIGVTRDVSIPILLYHGIVEEDDGENVTVENFREQMTALEENGYIAIDTLDLYAYLEEGAKLPERPVMITFDDARRDSYLYGDPILEELGFKAVMFVVTGKQDNEDEFFLSWDELRQMYEDGWWDIQAHSYEGHDEIQIDAEGTMGYYGSNKMWLAEQGRIESDEEYRSRLLNDLQTVKSDLEKNVPGTRVISFAFPWGDYGQYSINQDKETAINTFLDVVKGIYPLSFELNYYCSDFNNYDDSDPHLLKRLEVHSGLTADELIRRLSYSRAKKLPYSVAGFGEEELPNWFCNWGRKQDADNKLRLISGEDQSGAMAVLYGSHYWKDYSLQADITVETGSGFLIGRYRNENNYVACGIDEGQLVVREMVQGEFYTTSVTDFTAPGNEYTMELAFAGDTVTCRIDGQTVLGPISLNSRLDRGGVGFQVWNSNNPIAQLSVHKVNVSTSNQDKSEGLQAASRSLDSWMP